MALAQVDSRMAGRRRRLIAAARALWLLLVLGAAGPAAAQAPGMKLSQCSSAGFCRVVTGRVPVTIEAGWASSPDDIWLVGRGAVPHWDGTSWSPHWLPAYLKDVWGSGPSDVWAVGGDSGTGGSAAYRFDGQRWNRIEVPTSEGLVAVWSSGPGSVYFADRQTLLRFDGEKFTRFPHPGGGLQSVHALWGADERNIWVGGTALHHFDGLDWTAHPAPPSAQGAQRSFSRHNIQRIWGTGKDRVWTTNRGSEVPTHYFNGTEWRMSLPLRDVSGLGPDLVYAIDERRLYRLSRTKVREEILDVAEMGFYQQFRSGLHGLITVGRDDIILWGTEGIFRFQEGKLRHELMDWPFVVESITGNAKGGLWIGGFGGPALLRWTGKEWKDACPDCGGNIGRAVPALQPLKGGKMLFAYEGLGEMGLGISDGAQGSDEPDLSSSVGFRFAPKALCASKDGTLYTVGAGYGEGDSPPRVGLVFRRARKNWERVFESKETPAFLGVTCAPNGVFVSGAGGVIHAFDGRKWKSSPSGVDADLRAIWAAHDRAVWAVGGGEGNRAVVVFWNGSRWQQQSSADGSALYGVCGFGPRDVWAVGEGGTILHFDGKTWTRTPSGSTERLEAVHCDDAGALWVGGLGGTFLYRGPAAKRASPAG